MKTIQAKIEELAALWPRSEDAVRAAANFAVHKHRHQKRKYTGDQYVHHCLDVAMLYTKNAMPWNIEGVLMALLHDTLEDTDTTVKELLDLGMGPNVVRGVVWLTDVYTDPVMGNRQFRKTMEAYRLGGAPGLVQQVKLADMLDNTSSIVEHDPDFAVVYMREKEFLVKQLDAPGMLPLGRMAWTRIEEYKNARQAKGKKGDQS